MADRDPILIKPEVRERLRRYLSHNLAGTGVGYSDFIDSAISAHERGEWKVEQ